MNDDLHSIVSVDVVALHFDQVAGHLLIAVPARTTPPFASARALPGVVVRSGERLAEAAGRALAKFTDDAPTALGQLRTFDEPSRDPRGPSLSIAMYAVLPAIPADAAAPVDDLPQLAFDHNHIVESTREMLAAKLWADMDFTRALMPTEFTTVDARTISTALAGTPPHMGNLNRLIDNAGAKKVGVSVAGRGRPSVTRTIGT